MNLKRLLPMLLALASASVSAESIMISGKLEASVPTVSFSSDPGDKVAYVNSYKVSAVSDENGCSITTDINAAKTKSKVGSLVCYFQWLPNSAGMTGNGFELTGIPKVVGDAKFPWKISYFSGTEQKEVVVNSGEYVMKTTAPVIPKIVNISSRVNGIVNNGPDIYSYKYGETLTDITFELEPKNYVQVVTVSGTSSCAVPVGQTTCTIDSGNTEVRNTESLEGQRSLSVIINSENNYFSPPNQSTLMVHWDYRAPEFTRTSWNITDSQGTVSVDGTDVATQPKTVTVVVTSPHLDLDGEWWYPAGLSLTVDPNDKFVPQSKVTLDDGTVLDFGQVWSKPSKRTLQPVSGPQRIGNEFIYTFDIADLATGSYDASYEISDRLGNVGKYSEPDGVVFMTEAPFVSVMKDGIQLRKAEDIYFQNELLLVAYQGAPGMGDIEAVSVDGIAAKMTPTSVKGIYRLNVDWQLTLDTEHQISVTGFNPAGKKVTFTQSFKYVPAEFQLSGIEGEDALYSKVRLYTALFKQKRGLTCKFYSTEENAQAYLDWAGTRNVTPACYVQWNNVPAGMEFYVRSNVPGLTGYFSNDGKSLLDYTIYMKNQKGSVIVAALSRKQLEIEKATVPAITYKISKVVDGLNADTGLVYNAGGEVSKALVAVVPAEVDVTVQPDTGSSTTTHFKARSTSSKKASYVTRLKSGETKLWTKQTFDVTATYTRDSSLTAKSLFTVYTVPDKNIRASIKAESRDTATGLEFPVTVSVGKYTNACRCTKFDRTTMGDWDVQFFTETKTYTKNADTGRYETIVNRTPMSEKLPVADDGTVSTKIPADIATLGSHRLVGVATVRSPFADFEMVRETPTTTMRVYKGEELEGELTKSLIVSRIPVSAIVSFKTASTTDADALSPTQWEVSSDAGATWVPQTEYDGRRSFTLREKEVGKWLVRAKLTNKFTGKQSYTENLTVIGYDKPEASLKVTRVLEGHDIPVTMYDGESPIQKGVADIEWSEDKQDWTEGDPTYLIKASDSVPKTIYARVRYLSSDSEAGEKAWTEVSARISQAVPKRLSVKVEGETRIEVGETIGLTGSYTNPNSDMDSDVIEEWVLPDGSTHSGSLLDVKLAESMLTDGDYAKFSYRAWLKTAKDKTLSTRQVSVKSWKYKFPEAKLDTHLKYSMVPSNLTATFTVDEPTYPGVAFTREWMYDHDVMTITKDDGDSKSFNVTSPGFHTVTVIYKDNRGNVGRYASSFSIDAQSPMTLTMSPKYSTKFMRAPLDVSLRNNIKLAHSADSVDTVTFTVNGAEVEKGKNYWSQAITGLAAGRYHVEMKVRSIMGQEGTQGLDFEVVPNNPPVCELQVTESSLAWRLVMKCEDEDGKMSSYKWRINGESRSVYSSTATLSKYLNKGKTVVSVDGIDDSGAVVTKEVTLIGPDENASSASPIADASVQ